MRRKKWARPELAVCPWYVQNVGVLAGHWRERLPEGRPFHVELGCGKGVSTARMIADEPEVNFLAIDISPDVLGEARRNIVRACGGEPDNALLAQADIERIGDFLTAEDAVDRVYINFCNPWPRRRHEKRRLTHPRQLMQYRAFLKDGGEIRFKTDDDELFETSLLYFEVSGFEKVYETRDLHASGFTPNWVSEHETLFSAQGVPIKFGIFRKSGPAPAFDPLRWRAEDAAPAPENA